MKVKNIVFSGVMGAILMGATGAHAAISVASQGYVDAKVGKVATSVTELGTTVSSTYQTKDDAATAAQQTAAALDLKANAADVYTKEYVNTELAKLELKTDAIDKLNAAKVYTEEQINALKGALGTGGEGEEGGTGLTGQVLTNTSDIVSLKDKVGDKTVAQSIADAISAQDLTNKFAAKEDVSNKASQITEGMDKAQMYPTVSLTESLISGANQGMSDLIGAVENGKTVVGMIAEGDNALAQRVTNIEESDYATSGVKATTVAQVDTNKTDIAGIKAEQITQNSDIGTLKDTVAKLDGTGEGSVAKALTDAKTYADGKASAAQAAAEATAAGALDAAKTELEGKISAAQSAATYDDTKVKADIAANAGDISTIKGEQTTQNNAITALQESLAAGGATADAIADAKKAGTDANSALEAYKTTNDAAVASKVAQSDYDTKVQALEAKDNELVQALTTKIEMPAACETQDCVLSINKATNKVSWAPLTEPVEDFLN